MDFQAFDQTQGKGHRELWKNHCYFSAAIPTDFWHLNHLGTLKDWQSELMYFHSGQSYAAAGVELYAIAIQRFEKSINSNEPTNQEIKWNAYVRASIAFLKKDWDLLQTSRDEIALSK